MKKILLLTLVIAGSLATFSVTIEKKQIKSTNTETIQKAEEVSTEGDMEGDTFSIVAYDPATGEFGGAGTSCVSIQIDFLNEIIVDNSGNMIGAIHVQAAAQAGNANNAKARMLAGDNPQQIINWLANNDCCGDNDASSRQYGIVGFNNISNYSNLTTAAFTGTTNGAFGNHITGPNYSIQGNILDEQLGQQILENMETAFVNTQGSLAEKLMAALQGAKQVGSDKRCGPDGAGSFSTSNQYNSGRASFIRVRRPSDTGVSNNEGTNNFIDISVGPVGQFVEPIDVLQCAFDTQLGITDETCRETVSTFPYTMDFETTTWEQESSCNVANAWIRSEFATPTTGTGPTSANQGDLYSYYEATDLSGNNTGLGTTGYIGSPCFVIAEDKVATVTFDYHMYSTDTIGTLSLEANSGDGWEEVWSETGNKGTAWQTNETVSLIDYTGTTVKLRFKAAASNSFRNDFGLDNIRITTEDYCTTTATFNGSWNTPPTNLRATTIVSQDYTTSNGSIDACSLLVTNNATLTITSDTYVNVRSNITVDNGSHIIIEHQGSLVQVLESASVINNGNIDVLLITPPLVARDFMILGSPMDSENETVYDGAYQVLNHNTDNYTMFTSETIEGINFYDEGADELGIATGVLNPGEGYIVRPSFTDDGTFNYTYTVDNTGTLNSGEILYQAGYNGNKDDSANLLANPYPSAIDANIFLAENSEIISEIYFWEHLTPVGETNGPYGEQNFSMEDISTYNNMGGTQAAANGGLIPTNIISTGQGFGIKANAEGTVRFTNAMRVTSGNTTLRSTLTDANRLWLTVNNIENEQSSTNLIGFTSRATAGLDTGFDTEKMGTVVSLYTHLEDGSERLSIQSREAFDSRIEIPMGFSTYNEEELSYTISINKLEGDLILAAQIYLHDTLTGKTVNLKEQEYTFSTKNGTYDNRFIISFENNNLSTNEIDFNTISLYPNPTNDVIQLKSGVTIMTGAKIYDVRGRIVKDVKFDATSNIQIDVRSLNSGVFIMAIETMDGIVTTKRLIKK